MIAIVSVKTCKKCEKDLPLCFFGNSKVSKDGLDYSCLKCMATYKKQNYYSLKEKDPTHYKRRDRKYRLKSVYGMTPEQYEAMAEHQFHRCAVCGDYETRLGRGDGILNLNVDHDHKTGEIRGLLCNRCNRVLGMVEDDLTILSEMKNYLGDRNGN